MSELINREDNPKAKKTVEEVNKLLEDYCTATNLNLIRHRNILDRSLNISKLHFNRFGSSILAKNFVNTCIIFSIDCVPNRNSAVSEIESKNSIRYLNSLKGFRVGHLNIASLVKHVDELKVYSEREPLDVQSINETRLDGAIGTDIFSIPGYELKIWLQKIAIGKVVVLQFTTVVF